MARTAERARGRLVVTCVAYRVRHSSGTRERDARHPAVSSWTSGACCGDEQVHELATRETRHGGSLTGRGEEWSDAVSSSAGSVRHRPCRVLEHVMQLVTVIVIEPMIQVAIELEVS